MTGTVGTAKQSDGTTQVTRNGSPLDAFVADSAPGQVTGNNVTGYFVVTASLTTNTTTVAAAPGAPAPPASSAQSAGTPAAPAATASGWAASTSPLRSSSFGTSSAARGALAFTGTG